MIMYILFLVFDFAGFMFFYALAPNAFDPHNDLSIFIYAGPLFLLPILFAGYKVYQGNKKQVLGLQIWKNNILHSFFKWLSLGYILNFLIFYVVCGKVSDHILQNMPKDDLSHWNGLSVMLLNIVLLIFGFEILLMLLTLTVFMYQDKKSFFVVKYWRRIFIAVIITLVLEIIYVKIHDIQYIAPEMYGFYLLPFFWPVYFFISLIHDSWKKKFYTGRDL